MSRFALAQSDLFAPPAAPLPPQTDPLAELQGILVRLQAADRMPWPDAAAAMAEELHVLGLARRAGTAGAPLAAAILLETDRLLATTD